MLRSLLNLSDGTSGVGGEGGGGVSAAASAAVTAVTAVSALPHQVRRRLEVLKQQIAVACSEVMEGPENNIKQLNTVLQLCRCNDAVVGPAVAKLAIMSLATVFKDIIPTYRIRAEPEPTAGVQLAKDTIKLQVRSRLCVSSFGRAPSLLCLPLARLGRRPSTRCGS